MRTRDIVIAGLALVGGYVAGDMLNSPINVKSVDLNKDGFKDYAVLTRLNHDNVAFLSVPTEEDSTARECEQSRWYSKVISNPRWEEIPQYRR